ncbi:FAD dependent oxidoreductase [Mycena rosella]|uniref:FAD dependent oxidoreductase n=1 Tax=Mycena rosella TaxID=1033263 RepID=A0AAD7G9B7_MYCRO|nr:FAD dependent oxidoreductase [Mycena rosella]
MGTALSRVRLALQSLRVISAAYDKLNKRIQESPGIPVSDPSTPYWAIPAAPIAQHGSESKLPPYADVVIVGSGITGTAVARTLLDSSSKDWAGDLKIVMLEARDACSGATARNGGHITPLQYHDYVALKQEHGADMAKSIIKFRLTHLEELIRVSKEEDILADSQCREVETFDVFFDPETYDSAIQNLKEFLDDMPDQRKMWRVVGAEECVKSLQFSQTVVGAIATTGGAAHPYRLVTGILSRLLTSYPSNFHLFTHTPCLSITPSTGSGIEPFYTVSTSKGTIRARHVVHATNAWASHLLPPMRGKIVPVRAHMSAQRPGMGLGGTDGLKPKSRNGKAPSANDSVLTLTDAGTGSVDSWLGTRSFVMYADGRYDYLTQQPSESSLQSLYPSPAAEFMFGGGLGHGELAEQTLMSEVGLSDDRSWSLETGAYLGGALSVYFGQWGAEGRVMEGKSADNSTVRSLAGEEIDDGRVKKLWTGIIGVSADGRPWVGRLPAKISGRRVASSWKGKAGEITRLAPSGEWIAAGYSGEGMVHAYMSGKALAHMLLGHTEHNELPEALLVTEARWKKAKIESRIDGFVA